MKIWLIIGVIALIIFYCLGFMRSPKPREVWSAAEVIQMMPPSSAITVCGDHGAGFWCHTSY